MKCLSTYPADLPMQDLYLVIKIRAKVEKKRVPGFLSKIPVRSG